MDTQMLEKKTLSAEAQRVFCFVCTGNTCRSPMAAAVYNYFFSSGGVIAVSRGICADGSPISENAVAALSSRAIMPTANNDYVRHVSKTIDEMTMRTSEKIIALTSSHMLRLLMMFPEYAGKITAFPRDISDPFGKPAAIYESCLDEIIKAMREMFGDAA